LTKRRSTTKRTVERLSILWNAAFLCVALSARASAGEGSAETPECKEITARLIEGTSTHFDHFSPSHGSVFFKNPDMVLICDPTFITYVALNWDTSGFPPNNWFGLLAKAGAAVTGADPRRLEDGAHRCHRAALRDNSEQSRLELKEAVIECEAFTRDGGGVVIDVARPRSK
jgi:hypothetical protein